VISGVESEKNMKTTLSVLMSLVCMLAACASGGQSAKARFYQDELDIMLMQDKDYKEIIQVMESWEFGVLDTWEAVNPDESNLKYLDNRQLGKFSEQEKANVFKETGVYSVIFLLKLERRESASSGEISGMGLSTRKDNTVDIGKYTLIRTTFRNQRLIQFKIWTDITSSSVSGFKVKRHLW
jgi:hypothetical protein